MMQPELVALNINYHFKPAGITTAPGKQAANVTKTHTQKHTQGCAHADTLTIHLQMQHGA